MTNQEKIKWLRRYRTATAEQQRLENEIEKWRSLAEKVTPTLSGMPGGSAGPGRMVSALEHIVELEEELAGQITRCAAIRREIGQAIDGVQEERLAHLLRLRYVDGLTWEQIAVKMHYSYRQVCNLHGHALEALKIA